MVQTIFGHRDVVTCIHLSPESGLHGSTGNGLVATGSHDATVLLWTWCGKQQRIIGELAEAEGRFSSFHREARFASYTPPPHLPSLLSSFLTRVRVQSGL